MEGFKMWSEVRSHGKLLKRGSDYEECIAARWINHTLTSLGLRDNHNLPVWIKLDNKYKMSADIRVKKPYGE